MPYLFLFFRFISIVSMKESLVPLKINTIYFSTTISLSRWWTATGLVDLPDPNPDDPLNHEAAEVLRDNPRQFDINVKRSMAGGYVAGNHFPRCI
jgi:hypothetical protein